MGQRCAGPAARQLFSQVCFAALRVLSSFALLQELAKERVIDLVASPPCSGQEPSLFHSRTITVRSSLGRPRVEHQDNHTESAWESRAWAPALERSENIFPMVQNLKAWEFSRTSSCTPPLTT